jgi:hypothetical protein
MELKGRGNLCQTKGRIALSQQVEHGKCPVECLNFVGALRGYISHYDPQFRGMMHFQCDEIGTARQVLIRNFFLWEGNW